MIVNVQKARAELSKLIARAEAGEEIVIARRNKPAVKLVKLTPMLRRSCEPRTPGAWKGKLTVDYSFIDPLPEEELP